MTRKNFETDFGTAHLTSANVRAASAFPSRLTTARRGFLASAALIAIASNATANWTVINLHPSGATSSNAHGVRDGKQVGSAVIGGVTRASLWSGSASSRVDLNPAGSSWSVAYGVDGGQQVGYSILANTNHASLWSGTVSSWVDLTPAWAIVSMAFGVGGGQQVGLARGADNINRASLWSGMADSWVELHPAAATGDSIAEAVDAGQQVGRAYVGPNRIAHASLWFGTSASWVDLNPGTYGSIAFGVHGGEQVGIAGDGVNSHAALWRGSAASWVDLHPSTATASRATGVHDGEQVGYALVGGNNHACSWTGTAASWVDLHMFLSKKFQYSNAKAIWHDNTYTYVVGSGYNSTAQREEALLWRRRR